MAYKGNPEKEREQKQAEDAGKRALNGMYDDFFGGGKARAGEVARSGESVLVFGEEPGHSGESSSDAAPGKKAASGGRADSLARKGRETLSKLSQRADALLGKQKDMSSELKNRTDALQRANDALKEVQSLLDNPLYDGMPSLTGRGAGGFSVSGSENAITGAKDPRLSGGPDGGIGEGGAKTKDGAGRKEGAGGLDFREGAGGMSAPKAPKAEAPSIAGSAPEEAKAALEASEKAQEEKPQEPEKDPMEELDALIGLSKIKHDVKELADFVRIQKLRKDGGLKSVPVSLHLVFTGNPGTGKTTVARILAKIYKKIGVLSKGQLIEVDRSGLVAGYVGQTALKTAKKIEEAKGGILFIDEAYTLARRDDTFGQEAIDTILKAMEDNREDFVVIVAGYTGPMETFVASNPGLKSRFNKYIEFPDYSIDELMGIFDMNCKKYDYEAQEEVRAQIRAMIVQRRLAAGENFANAREVRNLFEEVITNQARRVAAMESPTREDMKAILADDLFETAEEDAAKTLKKAKEMEASGAGEAGGAEQSEAEKPAGEEKK